MRQCPDARSVATIMTMGLFERSTMTDERIELIEKNNDNCTIYRFVPPKPKGRFCENCIAKVMVLLEDQNKYICVQIRSLQAFAKKDDRTVVEICR
jgi:hypothetical protein